jgi:hypothetical protein
MKLQRPYTELLSPPADSMPGSLAIALLNRGSNLRAEDPFGNFAPAALDLFTMAERQKIEQRLGEWGRHHDGPTLSALRRRELTGCYGTTDGDPPSLEIDIFPLEP